VISQSANYSGAAYSSSSVASHALCRNSSHPYDGSAGARPRVARSQMLRDKKLSSSDDSKEHNPIQDDAEYHGDSTENTHYSYQTLDSQESYYLSSVSQFQDTTYPPELMIEEEQPRNTTNGEGNYSAYSLHNQDLSAMNQVYYAEPNSQDSAGPFSTTSSWSMQQRTEERLRLGLTRWENQEQERAAYEEVLRRS